MPGTNLSRDEARERAALLSVESYEVDLDVTRVEAFSSTTALRFECAEPGASTFTDLVDAEVHAITLNGRELDPAAVYDGVRLSLSDLAAENELRVVATCRYSRSGEGLHRFVDPADGNLYLYTQFEVPDARRVFTTFEQPDLKATFRFTVTAPAEWHVVSNAPTPEPEPADGGAAVWRFPPTPRISTYITALVAGPYHLVRDTYRGRGGEVPLGVYCRQSLAAHLDAEDVFEVTKQGFGFFEAAFGLPYPFEKYDQLFVPEYNMGAMENAGCVTLRDEYVFRSRVTAAAYEGRASTVLHELAHMWFGDLVTMRWWDDLWLNESFAEWAAHHAEDAVTRFPSAWTTFCNSRKNWAYRQDQLPSTHPIAADIVDLEAVEVNFDGITYAKGASALRQLVAWVGEDQFFAGLRAYFERHAWGNAELGDLLAALEESSGRDLGSWAKEWLQTSGVNTLRADYAVDERGRFTAFTVVQEATPENPTLRSHRVAIGCYHLAGDSLIRRRRVELDVTGEVTPVRELLGEVQPDLVLLNDEDLTYAKVRLDERSLATLVAGIDRFTDSLPRAVCWGAAWDMTRDAEMTATDFVELVLRGVAAESDLTAVQGLLRCAQTATELFTSPAKRPGVRDRWERGLRGLLDAAEPGSDHQLALVRAYASAAQSADAVSFLSGLLAGQHVPAGLSVDTDLRWQLLVHLARLGEVGDGDIDDEQARDATIAGQERAALAHAAQPTAAAKSRAWAAAVERDDVPNETQRSVIFGFWQFGQDEVLREYVGRYLDAAADVWQRKGVHMGSNVLEGLFPRVLATRETLRAVDDWLAANHISPAARRLVVEGRADLVRSLRAQKRDAVG